MAELNPKADLHPSNPGELAHVKAQLHSLLDTSSEMSKGIELAKTCVCGVRVARGAFAYLLERIEVGDFGGNVPSTAPGVESALHAVAHRGADQLVAGLEAQRLVNGVAATAAEALAALHVSLLLLSGNDELRHRDEVSEIHRQAAEVVSTCKGWVKLTAAMAQLLQLECAHLEHLLTQHVLCEQLTAETLLNARQGAQVKS